MKTCMLCESTSAGTAVTFRRRDICTWCEAKLARTGHSWCSLGRHKVVGNVRRCAACQRAQLARRKAETGESYTQRWRRRHPEHYRAYETRSDVRARKRAHERRRYWDNIDLARARERIKQKRRAARRNAWALRRYWSDPIAARLRARERDRRYEAKKRLAILRGGR